MAETKTAQPDVLADIESHTPESLHPILEAAFKYRKQVIIGVCAILAVTAVYAGFNAYTSKAMASAQAELGAILTETSGPDQIARLEGLLSEVPDSVKPAVTLEVAKACMAQGDYAKAATYWEAMAGNTEGEMQFVARMGKAKSLLLGDKASDALTEMKELVGIASAAYTVPVYRQLALTAEAAGDKKEALSAYKKLNENTISDKPFIEYKISQLETE
ncbi:MULTISPECIES: tetratricopeptide repeat protein [unclassified Pseudodesulfovibrio]|uniref:tetratricopeptide repeat protein n=1 Tax=unclassified Pseudodesulfovibrio TaxID=2661612 RepID=UPI000FEBC78C|nr:MULTISPECIES: tetratricopeptide repeat protein [unclassified Pseudodesulfovibrio]MCJ2162933.1 tetratricopeptide repeat protein [Pseudodesulfovibrio sp. S3-i]RWU06935.1 transcriptional regulator [Pseudodesulfovibrio sp. S3]